MYFVSRIKWHFVGQLKLHIVSCSLSFQNSFVHFFFLLDAHFFQTPQAGHGVWLFFGLLTSVTFCYLRSHNDRWDSKVQIFELSLQVMPSCLLSFLPLLWNLAWAVSRYYSIPGCLEIPKILFSKPSKRTDTPFSIELCIIWYKTGQMTSTVCYLWFIINAKDKGKHINNTDIF